MSPEQDKRLAFDALLKAWEQARGEGASAEALATASIVLALTEMVDAHGEGPVAEMAEGLSARIRAGEFTLKPG